MYTLGVVTGVAPGDTKWVVLTVACCSIVTATMLVWGRSRRQEADVRRSELARPAPEELTNWATETTLVDAGEGHLPPFGEGMLRYSAAVMDLLDHAIEVARSRGSETEDLITAREDAKALNSLLTAMAAEPARLGKVAKVHTICSLWESNQDRVEQEASEVDPDFHRRWRARNIAVLRLRHGDRPRREEPALPYQV